jgi:hypothetical protein
MIDVVDAQRICELDLRCAGCMCHEAEHAVEVHRMELAFLGNPAQPEIHIA